MNEFDIMNRRVDAFCARLNRPELEKMYRGCFYSTLRTTTERDELGTYVFTGDIPAMWLRDSSAQVRHYLPFCEEDAGVAELIRGLLARQFFYILIDPYANAFNKAPNGNGHRDETDRSDWVWERKYEVDSLCYPLDTALRYYGATGDASVFDGTFRKAFSLILDVFTTEQRHNARSPYRFIRHTDGGIDTLDCGGRGGAAGDTGMTWSGFRPSDDKCRYGYLIPANLFAADVLSRTAKILTEVIGDGATAARALRLSREIAEGVRRYGVVDHPVYGKIYAYETDGLGNHLLMDDANVPSLLSLPYLGCCGKDDEIYLNTRRFVLSRDNPYYFEGKSAAGVGSPHTPEGYIWHIGLIIRGLTSDSAAERERMMDMLTTTHAGKFYMHESFDKDDPSKYTREWFAWANSLFAVFCGELYGDGVTGFKEREVYYERVL